MQRASSNRHRPTRSAPVRAPLRRPGGAGTVAGRNLHAGVEHPLVDHRENQRLYRYEDGVKQAFDRITPVLKQISGYQHDADFEQRAQHIAQQELGFALPEGILADAWVCQLDMKRLFAWCVFETYHRFDVHQSNSIREEVLLILRK
mgnify:CR=1 FL=1